MKILFTASESLPFIKTGGLGDVAYALPKALADAGHEELRDDCDVEDAYFRVEEIGEETAPP